MTNTIIDHSTLMIDNYVTNRNKDIVKVHSLNHHGVNLRMVDNSIPECDIYNIEPTYLFEELYPILLTQETLSKIEGIQKHSNHTYDIKGIEISYINHDWYEFKTQQIINTLHELQNFYFWRYKHHLTINL